MKQFLYTLTFVFGAIGGVRAQQISIGFHAGKGFAQLSNYRETKNDAFGADRVASHLFGGSVDFYLGRRVAIGTGFDYARKGNERYDRRTFYHYLEMPFTFRFDLISRPDHRFLLFARAGTYWAFLQEQTGDPANLFLSFFPLESSSVQNFDYGLTGGLGADIRLSDRFAVGAEFRFDRGLSDVFGQLDCVGCARERISNIAAWGLLGFKYLIPSPYDVGK